MTSKNLPRDMFHYEAIWLALRHLLYPAEIFINSMQGEQGRI